MANISRKMARARLNEALAMHLINDFTEYGAEVIAKLRRDRPADYLKMVTTAFENDEPPPAPRSMNSRDAETQPARTEAPPRGPKVWLTDPLIEEVIQLTSRPRMSQ